MTDKLREAAQQALTTIEASIITLEAANEQGKIKDTIWFAEFETLFDFLGSEADDLRERLAQPDPLQRFTDVQQEIEAVLAQPEQKQITTDRELLELAAKAIGIKITWHGDVDPWCFAEVFSGIKWNPLTDDGDNRRLQVDLRIELIMTDQSANACFNWVFYSEPLGKDARKAARRAVVRAAAEIGRGMK